MNNYDEIWIAAETLYDIEQARIGLEHRLRSTGLQSVDHRNMLDAYKQLEADWVSLLVGAVKQHPLYPWIRRTKGIGEKTAGRFLGIVPDPAWHDAEDRPRTLYELQAYCGLHVDDTGEAARRRRGQQSNWNTHAKTRLYLMAEAVLKAQGPLSDAYYVAKDKALNAQHRTLCPLCKRDAGTPLTAGHAHKRAMRALMKAILREMWTETRAVGHVGDLKRAA